MTAQGWLRMCQEEGTTGRDRNDAGRHRREALPRPSQAGSGLALTGGLPGPGCAQAWTWSTDANSGRTATAGAERPLATHMAQGGTRGAHESWAGTSIKLKGARRRLEAWSPLLTVTFGGCSGAPGMVVKEV